MDFKAIDNCMPFRRRLSFKTLLVMKLLILLTIVATFHANGGVFGQKITLSQKDASLETIFREIEKQTGYDFLYNAAWLRETHSVSLDVKDSPLENVLDLCFKDQPFTYSITNNTIVIRQKESFSKAIERDGPGNEIRGRLTNIHGEPLVNASIIIKRSKIGSQTNANGEFKLKNVRPDDVLSISFIGYKPLLIKVADKKQFTLVMDVTDNDLDKVVIQAYGTTSRRFATGDITTVTAAEIERQPVMNPLLALQGKVAGLDVNQTSGYASGPVKVELRGRSGINDQFNSDPLYIIDGVPLTVVEVGGVSNYQNGSTGFLQSGLGGPANGQSPLFSMNPADIESIAVLKDADALAIYGSRGAKGVIIITTKKGMAGKTKFDLHIDQGTSKATRFYKLMNTSQYLAMRREAFANDAQYGVVPNPGNSYDLAWDTTRYTDWQRALYGNTGKNISVQMSLSGGDARNTFRLSAGYNRITDILTVSGANQRASLSFNLNHATIDHKFTVSLSTEYSLTNVNTIALPGTITLAPNAPSIYDSAGNLNYNGWGGQNIAGRNAFPFSSLKQPYFSKTSFLNSSISLAFHPMKGLSLSTNVGGSIATANQQSYSTIAAQDPLGDPTGSSKFGYNDNQSWIIEPQISYEEFIGPGKIDLLFGGTIQDAVTDGVLMSGYGYTTDLLLRNISNAVTPLSSDNYGQYKYTGIFARINYILKNKYILNIAARRDGSSKFGAGKQFGNFGSVGAAWIFSDEALIKKIKFLSFGKLLLSYGVTGNDGVGDYQYLTQWSSNGAQPYDNTPSLIPLIHANPYFQWEADKKFQSTLNIGLFKDHINVSVAYYRNRVGNQLVSFPTPAFTGFTNVTANSPALVQNDGWEFSFNVKILHNKNFDCSLNFNTAINRNKLVAYPNFNLSPYVGKLQVGQPLNIQKVLHYTGVDPQTGEYTFFSKTHTGQIAEDATVEPNDNFVVNLSPKFFGGGGVNFSYKSLQCSFFFNLKKQIGRNGTYFGSTPGVPGKNQPLGVLARWQKPGDIAPIARFTTQTSLRDAYFTNYSDGGLTDASFIRLSNLSISYNLPSGFIRKFGMQGCSVYFHTNNLFVITKYKGIDPETLNFGGLPPAKFISCGLSFSF